MTKDLGINTSVALQNARITGLVIRDFVSVYGKDRSTGAHSWLCLWSGEVPVDADIIDPHDGSTISRTFQHGALVSLPSIPAGLETEVRTIRVRLSKLSPAALNIIRTYDAKMAPIQIHRGVFDLESHRLVDPALCRFDGYINNAPIKTPKVGGDGYIEAECVSRSRILTKTSGKLFSDEVLQERSGDRFGQYLDTAADWRIWWGQEESIIAPKKDKPKERFFRG